ncbi:MAG TPA: NUDIX hydrolase [Thermoplasmata archaeon]|nr:NUDIX hydrolase [Thermoplasmata archaeon]
MPKAQRHPWVTVDGLVLRDAKLVAVIRRNPPFQGMPALPGGFVELGETVETAVVREVQEETGLETRILRLVGVYSDPSRDPRGHTVSAAYALEPIGGELKAGSDAKAIALLDPDHLPPMAFDHATIVADWRRG